MPSVSTNELDMSNLPEIKVFAGENSQYIAESIASSLGLELGKKTFTRFSDGEFVTSFDETVRGEHVFIVQSTFPPSDNLMELLLMIDAAKRASAYKVIAVIPYFGFARQDRKDKPRVAIGAKLVANMLQAAGVDRIITMDLHADQIQGFFDVPVDHLYGSTVLIPYIKSLGLRDFAIASPDIGGAKRANSWAKYFDSGLIICHKTRIRANEVADMKVIGDVEGKNIIVVDDMIDTAGTICKAADMLIDNGAASVRAVATHAVLSGKAYENIEKSKLTEVIFTDSIPQKQPCSKIKVLPIAPMFADTIRNIYEHKSISDHFLMGGAQAVITFIAVLEAQQFLAVMLPAARLLPEIGGLDHGHEQFLKAGGIDLLAHHIGDFVNDFKPQRQINVQAGSEPAHHARTQQKFVADHLGVGRGFLEGGNVTGAEAHGYCFLAIEVCRRAHGVRRAAPFR